MSYSKGDKINTSRRSEPRKQKFHGNQHSNKKEDFDPDASASAKKLNSSTSESVSVNPLHFYRIVEFFTLFTALSDILICGDCKQKVKFEETAIRGLGFKLVVKCNCGSRQINSCPIINTGFEINRRIVFVMRLLGVGRQGLNLFCSYMDICNGIAETTYNRIFNHIHGAAKKVFDYCCEKAVEEEKNGNEKLERPILNFKVSGDGTWKKRGFKSLFGVTTLIAYNCGKVVDLDVRSSYCHACAKWHNKSKDSEEYLQWKEKHDEEEFNKNHEGSAGSMEVESVKAMFSRSEERHGVKYGNYIGDGDSKTFLAIINLNPYNDDPKVLKSECIGHVQKRIGTRLRNIRKTKKLGGKGKLTEALVKKLSAYYGVAIRRNIDSVENMKKGIMATFYHKISTNENPRHEYCPEGEESWCEWQKRTALGMDPGDHPAPLHPDVQKEILPIYEDLSRDELLERCLGGHTQNANESFNSTIWRLAPKHLHCGLKVVEVAAYLATGLFNEGNSSLLMVMNEAGIIVGSQSFNYAQQMDEQRVKRQNRRNSMETKEARVARKAALQAQNEAFEEEEGLLYGAGIAD